MLIFEDIKPDNWQRFESFVLKTELSYPEEIRTERDEYIEIILEENIAKSASFNSEYIGNAIGYPLTIEDVEFHDLTPEMIKVKAIYLFNFAVEPIHQGKGYGMKLLLEFIKSAKEKGYEKLLGHFRPNASLALIKKAGGKELKICKNWENTGEDYVLCELDLKSFQLPQTVPN
ncbi:GNAT family N-acetyltransferase [Candidatus Woesearchaeota archaeon]|nr:GNAT family N-acetyltransferase [Candidatus Woesearchaeota archaeon]